MFTKWPAFAVLNATSALRLDENIGQAPKSDWARPPLPPLQNPTGGVGTEGLNIPEPPINGPFGSHVLSPALGGSGKMVYHHSATGSTYNSTGIYNVLIFVCYLHLHPQLSFLRKVHKGNA